MIFSKRTAGVLTIAVVCAIVVRAQDAPTQPGPALAVEDTPAGRTAALIAESAALEPIHVRVLAAVSGLFAQPTPQPRLAALGLMASTPPRQGVCVCRRHVPPQALGWAPTHQFYGCTVIVPTDGTFDPLACVYVNGGPTIDTWEVSPR
jgi:hypothetical protein